MRKDGNLLNAGPLGRITVLAAMAYVAEKKGAKRHYHDWYNYETRKTSPWEAFWMIVFTVALCAGLPLMFAAVFHYGVPILGKIW